MLGREESKGKSKENGENRNLNDETSPLGTTLREKSTTFQEVVIHSSSFPSSSSSSSPLLFFTHSLHAKKAPPPTSPTSFPPPASSASSLVDTSKAQEKASVDKQQVVVDLESIPTRVDEEEDVIHSNHAHHHLGGGGGGGKKDEKSPFAETSTHNNNASSLASSSFPSLSSPSRQTHPSCSSLSPPLYTLDAKRLSMMEDRGSPAPSKNRRSRSPGGREEDRKNDRNGDFLKDFKAKEEKGEQEEEEDEDGQREVETAEREKKSSASSSAYIRGDGNQQLWATGVANVVCAFFGGMGGGAMIGLSVMNLRSGGKGKESGVLQAVFVFILIGAAYKILNFLPVAALAGIMFCVAFHTFKWFSLPMVFVTFLPETLRRLHPCLVQKITRADALIVLVVTLCCVSPIKL
ncbi:inorganic anion sulfate permease family protein [Cystoisospora suis]|uniref:Inorganic anion sulfate permease family protein n=1 Tax=Cystoisospora suis TaxID=483139 RepID=A0A2C6JVA0_9APIC|nr:inorganic anion sulfate permease family protein [Cystoisospora suis]